MATLNGQNKKRLPIHPAFFALFPILYLYWDNIWEVRPADMLSPIAFVLGVTVVVLALVALILRNVRKAAFITSIALILCFSFGDATTVLRGRLGMGFVTAVACLLTGCCVVFAACTYLVVRSRRDLGMATMFLNALGIALVLIPLAGITSHEITTTEGRDGIDDFKQLGMTGDTTTRPAPTTAPGDLPDIYYIILDRYPSDASLKELYDFDNSGMTAYLRGKGFYVATRSKANYLKTAHSLASSLNMDYLRFPARKDKPKTQKWLPVYRMLGSHRVGRLLKSMGYRYVHFGSWFGPTSHNEYADVNVNYKWMSEFSMSLYESTALLPVLGRLFGLDGRMEQRQRVLYKFSRLAEVPKTKRPVFAFAHFIIPHPPYIFDADGSHLSRSQVGKRSEEVNFVNHVRFTNKKTKELIDRLMLSSRVPPIIILQSDEGPFPARYVSNAGRFKWREASSAELRQKMQILSAYYLPGVDKGRLYPSISPVNSFRLVFNLYFGTDYELLPDRCIAFEDHDHLYDFFDVTAKIEQ